MESCGLQMYALHIQTTHRRQWHESLDVWHVCLFGADVALFFPPETRPKIILESCGLKMHAFHIPLAYNRHTVDHAFGRWMSGHAAEVAGPRMFQLPRFMQSTQGEDDRHFVFAPSR